MSFLMDAGRETERLNKIIEGHSKPDKTLIEAVLKLAEKAKPVGWDVTASKIAKLYSNKQVQLTKAKLQKIAPKQFDKYPVRTVNVIRLFAELDTQVYRQPVERWAELRDDETRKWLRPGSFVIDAEAKTKTEVLPDQSWRQQAIEDLVEAAGLEALMVEWERRAAASLVHFARIAPRNGLLEHCLFWPNLIGVVEDRRDPGLRRARYVTAQIGPELYELWRKVKTSDGHVYQGFHIDLKGIVHRELTEWGNQAEHPFFALHAVYSAGSLWPDESGDAVENNVGLNALLSSWEYLAHYQGFKQRWISGDRQRGKKEGLVGGVGSVWHLPKDATAGEFDAALDMNHIDGAEKMLRLEANVRRQNPDAVAMEPGPPLSGISRTIRNIPSDQKREENALRFGRWEQYEFLPALYSIAVAGRLVPSGVMSAGARLRVKHSDPPVYEEPETKRLKWSNKMRDGWVSPALASVKEGTWGTIEEAVAHGVSDIPLVPQAAAPPSRARVPGSEPVPDVPEGAALNEGGDA